MSILTFPSVVPFQTAWTLSANSLSHTSPLSRVSTYLELSGAKWSATLSFRVLDEDEAAPLEAFLSQLGNSGPPV